MSEAFLSSQQNPQDSTPQTISLFSLLRQLIEKSFQDLQLLAQILKNRSDVERKLALVKYFKKTRIQFVRFLVLVKWVAQLPTVKKSLDLLHFLQQQENLFSEVADQMYFIVNQDLRDAKAFLYDVPTAVDVLTTGSYQQMPTIITRRLRRTESLSESSLIELKQELNALIYKKLLTLTIPSKITFLRVEDGQLRCGVKNEFEVSLTLLEGFGEKAPWTVVSLELFVAPLGEKKYIPSIHNYALLHLITERLRTSDKPLVDLYTIAHEFCLAVIMDILNTQAKALLESKRSFLITEVYSNKELSQLRVYYWKNPTNKILSTMNPDDICLSFTIENNELKISHRPTLIDIHTNAPVTLQLNPSQVSLEKMLLKSAGIYIESLILKLFVQLQQQQQQNRMPPPLKSIDFVLAPHEDETLTHLEIRFFDRHRVDIFVHLYTGRYILKTNSNFKKEFLTSLEESLNSNPDSIMTIVTQLCYQGLLSKFEHYANHLNLDIFNQLPNPTDEIVNTFSKNVLFLKYRDLNITDSYLTVDIDTEFNIKFALLVVKKEQNQMKLRKLLHVDTTDLTTITFHENPVPPFQLFISKSETESGQEKKRKVETVSESVEVISQPSKKIKTEVTVSSDSQTSLSFVKIPQKSLEFQISDHSEQKLQSQLRKLFYAVVDACKIEICTLCLLFQLSEHSITQWTPITIAENLKSDNENSSLTPSSSSLSLIKGKIFDINQLRCGSFLHGRDFLRMYKFVHQCEPLLVSELTLIVSDNTWKVIVPEVYPTISYHSALRCEGHISYVEKEKSWVFSYKSITRTCFKDFLTDISGLCSILSMLKQYQYLSNEPTTRPLCDYFKIHSFSAFQLTLIFGEQREHLARIIWKREHGFSFNTFPIAYPFVQFMTAELNARKNIFTIMQVLYNTFEPLQTILKFLETPPPKFLPCDFVLIPRSLHHVRLIYRNLIGIDIRFLGQKRIVIEDATKTRGRKGSERPFDKTQPTLHEIDNFLSFLNSQYVSHSQHSTILNLQGSQLLTLTQATSPTSPDYRTPPPPPPPPSSSSSHSNGTSTENLTPTPNFSNSTPPQLVSPSISQKTSMNYSSLSTLPHFPVFNACIFITHDDLELFLQCFHKYAAYLFFFYQLNFYKLDGPIKVESPERQQSFIIRTETLQATFTFTDFLSGVDISLVPFSSQQQTLTLESKLQSTLIPYFREKIAVEPYRFDYFLSFLNILVLPSSLLLEFLEILEMEKRGIQERTSGALYVELPLSTATFVPQANALTPSIIFRKSTSEFQFLVHIRRQEQTLLELPLLYNMKTRLVTVANAVPNDPRITLLSEVTTKIPYGTTITDDCLVNTLRALLKISPEKIAMVSEKFKSMK